MPAKMPRVIAALLLTQTATAWAASPSSWDVSKNFSSTHNPSGVWKYSGNGTLLNIGGDGCGSVDSKGCPGRSNGQNEPDAVVLQANNTGATLSGATVVLPAGYVQFDPQSGYGTISWAAPANGTYAFVGSFLGIDTNQGAHYVHINQIGQQAPIFDASIAAYGQSAAFSFSLTLTKGQTVAFTVQAGSGFSDLSTGLSLQITLTSAN